MQQKECSEQNWLSTSDSQTLLTTPDGHTADNM